MKPILLPSSFGESPETLSVFAYLLDEYRPNSPCVDLGTGHGKYAIICNQKGLKVTGIDGRPDRIPFDQKEIEWIVSDVMDADLSGYKTVLFCGLLYHLPYESQVRLLSGLNSCELLMINTHFADVRDGELTNVFMRENLKYTNDPEGAVYHEADLAGDLKHRPMAALNNTTSFWPTIDTLEQMLNNAGFQDVAIVVPFMSEHRSFVVAKR